MPTDELLPPLSLIDNNAQPLLPPKTCPLSCVDQNSLPPLCAKKLRPKALRKPVRFTLKQVREFTKDFSEANFIGRTQFGKVYRGKMPGRSVTVKIWDETACQFALYDYPFGDDFDMLEDEKKFLSDLSVKGHPNLVKMIGFCKDTELMAAVYELDPRDTLHNLITKDDFGWLQRVEVARDFARLLEFLHFREKPYLIFNIDAAHIMLDKDYKPLLFDFGLMSGGILGEMRTPKERVSMSLGYVDICFAMCGDRCLSNDVFSYGSVLLSLIAKRVVERDPNGNGVVPIDSWASKMYMDGASFVHRSLEGDSDYCHKDGVKLTLLGMKCIQSDMFGRPDMDGVVEELDDIVKCLKAGVEL